MERSRRVWQHEVSDVSVDQLKECFHRSGWVVIPMVTGEDYGEDFFLRIFHKGNPTGHDFYIQLKGTKKVAAYRLKSGELSCPIEAITLAQWHDFPIPVVLVLWDIERRVGYWQHVQPFIEECLKKKPRWLSEPGAFRRVRIPATQELQLGELDTLKETIETEFAKLVRVQKSLDVVQEATLASISRALEVGSVKRQFNRGYNTPRPFNLK